MGKKQFCFFETAETGNRTPNSGVKGSGANHYPRAPARRACMKTRLLCVDASYPDNEATMSPFSAHINHLSPQNDECRPCDKVKKIDWIKLKVIRGQDAAL